MGSDDDSCTVAPPLPDLGTLIGDVPSCIQLTLVEVNGCGAHREEGDKEYVACQVPASGLVDGNIPCVLDSPDLSYFQYTFSGHPQILFRDEEVEAAGDDDSALGIVIVVEPCLCEEFLDGTAIPFAKQAFVPEAFLELQHQQAGDLVA